MSQFAYKEAFRSKTAVQKRYYYKILSLYKMKLLCSDKDKKQRIDHRIQSLHRTNGQKDYPSFFNNCPNSRLVIYTAIFGNYDVIKPIGIKSPRCDYYLITDQNVIDSKGWTVLRNVLPYDIENQSNSIKNRYCKMHPEILFPQYEYSLYIDGVIEPRFDLFPLLGRMNEHFIGMYRHYARDCIYDEADTVVRIGKADKEETEQMIRQYQSEGFPHHFGLTAGGLILRKHNDEVCRKIMAQWWDMYLSGPKRDQLSLMYCMWKNGYSLNDIADLGASYEIDPRLVSEAHI